VLSQSNRAISIPFEARPDDQLGIQIETNLADALSLRARRFPTTKIHLPLPYSSGKIACRAISPPYIEAQLEPFDKQTARG
jgi:hypothetical protein